jgi:hypothetical protein
MSRELERLLSSQEPSIETLKRKRVDSDVQSSKRAETIANYRDLVNQNGSQWREDMSGMQAMNDSQRPKSPPVLAIDVSPSSPYLGFCGLPRIFSTWKH